MHPLDFISDSPNLYLFHKKSIKTNFGGFLFLIYLIIIILIIIYYIIDYIKNDKYIIQSFTNTNIDLGEDVEDFFNPNINFTIAVIFVLKNNKLLYNNNIKIYDNLLSKFITHKTKFNKKVKDFDIQILYECIYSDCSDFEEEVSNKSHTYLIKLSYDYFYLDHQNKNNPIIRDEDDEFYQFYSFNTYKSSNLSLNWKNIRYKEKKGFFQKDDEDHCGYIENFDKVSYEPYDFANPTEEKNKKFVSLCNIYFRVDNTQYVEYFRKRISELDIIANILSLVVNIFSCVKIVFGFYSRHFINFKIVEKISNQNIPTKNVIKINKSSEMSDLENNKLISIKEDLSEKCLDTNGNEENQNQNKTDNNTDELEEESDNYEESNQDIQKLKKLHFFDFFLNNIYSLCKKRKAQNVIHLCNKIVYKYASIDTLVENQIILEKLFKDYKWNQPSLNNLENNNLFIQLKTYL